MNTIEEDILITKALSGDALPDELILLDTWRKSSAANEVKFNEMEKIWLHAAQSELEINTDAAWQKVKLKTEQRKLTVPLYQQTWLRVAAVLAVITTVGWFGFRFAYNPMVTIETAAMEQKEIQLPDGSKVWLNENSKLSYHKKLNGEKRNVQLEGEAFFEVVKNPAQPFVMEAAQATTEVLGTSFNLKVLTGTLEAELSVATGKVRFTSANQKEAIAVAGQKVAIDKNGEIEMLSAPVSVNDMAWKTRKLVFNNTPLKDVFTTLENYFKIEIKVENPNILNCHFTAEFNNPKLEQVLDVLDKTLQLSHTKEGKKVRINGKGCQP
jgi:transmembrane sensor